MRIAILVSLGLTFATCNSVFADVRLPAIFGSHMVLQQAQRDRVWGWADPGERVTVSIANQTHQATAGSDGKWMVTLDAMSVGGPHTMKVSGKNTISLEDVLVGEVWICSGQSNMQWSVLQSNNPDLETRTAKFPKIRLISVPQVGTQTPQDDFKGKWSVCSPETVGEFSAVGYYFGRQLYQTLDVPIGLIDNAWGGSACEAWIRRDLLSKEPRYKKLMDRWQETESTYDFAKLVAEFEQKEKEWKELAAKAKQDGTAAPPAPRRPGNLLEGNARPANIYNGVLKPTIGFGIRGAIWYQGETNASRAYEYRELFPLMIKSWRDEWGQGDFSFYWVQLADFKQEKADPDESDWAELREAQTMAMDKLPKSGQAVIVDIGEGQDIHPRNKQDVALRLARWALAKDYGINVAHRSPQYKSMEKDGDKIVITFDHVGGGLKPFDVGEAVGFSIAGSDKKFVWAKGRVMGPDKVVVSADGVSNPVAVRYAWSDNPVCNLYSREGLPATPFRTDDWPGVTANN